MLRKLLEFLGSCVIRSPRLTIAVYVVLLIASGVGTVCLLHLNANQDDLISPDLEYNRLYREFLERFGDIEFVYVVVQVEDDPERAESIIGALASEMEDLKREGHIESFLHRVPLKELGYGLLFQDEESLSSLVETILERRDELSRFAALSDYASLFAYFADLIHIERVSAAAQSKEQGGELARWGFNVLETAVASVESGLRSKRYEPPIDALSRRAGRSLRERGYLSIGEGKLLLIEALPTKEPGLQTIAPQRIAAIHAALDRTRDRFPDAQIGLTGRPILHADEMATTESDMQAVTIVALVGVSALFVTFFRRLLRPTLAVMTLVTSIGLTFVLVSVTIGYLTLFSIIFATMLVGLGIDFGIHFVARYQEEIDAGATVPGAIQTTLSTSGRSIGTGALTTAFAFFTTLLVEFKGLQELGAIAGVGVIVCFITTVTLLPALLILFDERAARRDKLRIIPVRHLPLIDQLAAWPRTILTLSVVFTLSGLFMVRGIPYNYNLLDLQAHGVESVDYERLLIEKSDMATWYAAFLVDDVNAAREALDQLAPLQANGIVGRVESALDLIPEKQAEKKTILSRVSPVLETIRSPAPSSTLEANRLTESIEAVLDSIDSLQDPLLKQAGAGDAKSVTALKELDALASRLDALIEGIEADPTSVNRLLSTQKNWFGEFGILVNDLKEAFQKGPFTPQNLPAALRNRFVSADGTQLVVKAYPNKNIWLEEHMVEFMNATRGIDPTVNGTPMHFYESAWRMREGFALSALYSFGVVFVLLYLDRRRFWTTLLAMVPLFLGLLWLVEVISVIDLPFNMANMFAVPILIGSGIDGGVHIVHRFFERRSSGDVTQNTCNAVSLSFLTTMIGFGAMSFASHRGVASLGQMMFLGLSALLISSVVVLPAFLTIVEKYDTSK